MLNKYRSVLVISIFMIAALAVSACTQSLSSAPAETPTLIATGLFVSPIASVENPMAMIEEFAKQTEAAQTAAAGGTPAAATTVDPNVTVSAASGTPSAGIVTPTATIAVLGGTPTNANAVAATPIPVSTSAPAATSMPVGSRPSTYTLQAGEFPYCIARRFNVDPTALLQASGLTDAQANSLSAGTVLTIPQSASAFPGSRALRAHPASYSVVSGDETVYSIACLYGDVDPNSIASVNGISASAKLTAGQTLQIP